MGGSESGGGAGWIECEMRCYASECPPWARCYKKAPGANQGPSMPFVGRSPRPDDTARPHDQRCEAEWISGARGYSPCGCAERAAT